MGRVNKRYLDWTDVEGKILWELYNKHDLNIAAAAKEFIEKHDINNRTLSSVKGRIYRMAEWGDYIERDEDGNPLRWTVDEIEEIMALFLESNNCSGSARRFSELHPHRSVEACVSQINKLRKERGMEMQSKPFQRDIEDDEKDTTDYYVLDVGQFNIDMRERIFAEMEALR